MSKWGRVVVAFVLILLTVATAFWLWKSHEVATRSGRLRLLAANNPVGNSQTPPSVSVSAVPKAGTTASGQVADGDIALVLDIEVRDIERRAPYLLKIQSVGGLLTHYEVHRQYGNSRDYELGLEREIRQFGWKKYPPVSFGDALSIARHSGKVQEPVAPFGEQLIHFRNSAPSYAFRTRFSSDPKYLLIDAESGDVSFVDTNEPTVESIDKIKDNEYLERLRRYAMMRNGRMHTIPENLHEMSESDRKQLLEDVKLTNQMIETGELVLDDRFQIIYQRP